MLTLQQRGHYIVMKKLPLIIHNLLNNNLHMAALYCVEQNVIRLDDL